ncbi:MAG: hypothetical protein ACOX9R_01270 [Armatimonadota bacterium]|jgi:O-acetyl-ADP-ribose deacetylase (regulator of RNase III)
MTGAIEEFAGQGTNLQRVALVLFGEDAFEAFDRAAGERWGE